MAGCLYHDDGRVVAHGVKRPRPLSPVGADIEHEARAAGQSPQPLKAGFRAEQDWIGSVRRPLKAMPPKDLRRSRLYEDFAGRSKLLLLLLLLLMLLLLLLEWLGRPAGPCVMVAEPTRSRCGGVGATKTKDVPPCAAGRNQVVGQVQELCHHHLGVVDAVNECGDEEDAENVKQGS